MNFSGIQNRFEGEMYSGQMDSDVTYAFVLNKPVPRLVGESDILYIGKTEQVSAHRSCSARLASKTSSASMSKLSPALCR